jgi:hypothetical protein
VEREGTRQLHSGKATNGKNKKQVTLPIYFSVESYNCLNVSHIIFGPRALVFGFPDSYFKCLNFFSGRVRNFVTAFIKIVITDAPNTY